MPDISLEVSSFVESSYVSSDYQSSMVLSYVDVSSDDVLSSTSESAVVIDNAGNDTVIDGI